MLHTIQLGVLQTINPVSYIPYNLVCYRPSTRYATYHTTRHATDRTTQYATDHQHGMLHTIQPSMLLTINPVCYIPYNPVFYRLYSSLYCTRTRDRSASESFLLRTGLTQLIDSHNSLTHTTHWFTQLIDSHNSLTRTTHWLTQLIDSHNSLTRTTHWLTQLIDSHNSLHIAAPEALCSVNTIVDLICSLLFWWLFSSMFLFSSDDNVRDAALPALELTSMVFVCRSHSLPRWRRLTSWRWRWTTFATSTPRLLPVSTWVC